MRVLRTEDLDGLDAACFMMVFRQWPISYHQHFYGAAEHQQSRRALCQCAVCAMHKWENVSLNLDSALPFVARPTSTESRERGSPREAPGRPAP